MKQKNNVNNLPSTRLGLCITYPSVGVVERIGPDWDWIWIDAQHGQFGYQDLISLVRICDLIDRQAFVRVASHEAGCIGQVLDMGAAGVIVPCVDTPGQAQALVNAAKLPPEGNRSYGGRRVIDRQTRSYSQHANLQTMLVLQIESPEGLRNVEKLAAIPGVGALFFGPDDMRLRRGFGMDSPPAEEIFEQELSRMVCACHTHGKQAITVATTPGMQRLSQKLGVGMMVGAADAWLLSEASRRRVSQTRSLLSETFPEADAEDIGEQLGVLP